MARFKKNDIVKVNGEEATIKSWPKSDEGPFTYTTKARNGADVHKTGWTSNTNVELSSKGDEFTRETHLAAVKLLKAAAPSGKIAGITLPSDLMDELEADRKARQAEKDAKVAMEEELVKLRAMVAGYEAAKAEPTTVTGYARIDIPGLTVSPPAEPVPDLMHDLKLSLGLPDPQPTDEPQMPVGWGRGAGRGAS